VEITKTWIMKNFIVPVDFSVDSLKGLDWALLFSQRKSVNIQMVYVLTNSSNFQSKVTDEEHKYAESQFNKLIRDNQPKLGNNSNLRYIIKKGKVYREVVNQVNSYKEAVVSASTHGASGFEELFIGSNALKIIAATDQPVFTLRHSPVPQQIKKIVMPIKLNVDTRQKAPYVAEVAALFDAEVHVIPVSTRKNKNDLTRVESYAKQVVNYLHARDLKTVSKTLVGEHLPDVVSNYCDAVDGDMIAIMSMALNKWSVFLGSFSQQMINRANVPLLSITPKEKHIPPGFTAYGG
jgi:nucleotide-binding universal stress UspA family protein